jgi:hypothetical protein
MYEDRPDAGSQFCEPPNPTNMLKGVRKQYLRVEPSNSKFENVKPMSDRFSALVELSKRSAAFEAKESKPDSAILNSASASWLF